MDETGREWMAYVDAEVRAACEKKGWRSQMRRRWSVRDKAVTESSVEDYEWKLIPDAAASIPEGDRVDEIDEGVYYVLRLDRPARKLVLQHDTEHRGDVGPDFVQHPGGSPVAVVEGRYFAICLARPAQRPHTRNGDQSDEGAECDQQQRP